MKKVFVVGTAFFHYFQGMYEGRGYQLVDNINDADIVQFTGGADIAPRFYKQHEHERSYTSPHRDEEEYAAYMQALNKGKFMAGVCRGGQLLNALSGGSMYQDVRGHGLSGTHGMVDTQTGDVIPVSSVHHQMMVAGPDCVVLGISETVRSPVKLSMTKFGEEPEEVVTTDDNVELEAVWYPHNKAFCFQPHPEFVGDRHPCRDWYFKKLEELYALSSGTETEA